ncbi:MAG: hypothetical protein U1C55_04095 [Smithellaceae bacterium]|nr:hypothetical protein [Smithellaceae bacterium]
MLVPEVKLEEWRKLYQAAADFLEQDSWDWIMEEDIFGVRNPDTGEIGYCSILSSDDSFPGLAVHLGTRGLESFMRCIKGEDDSVGESDETGEEEVSDFDSLQHLSTVNCLMLSYSDREQLEEEDRQVIKSLGLKFRGRGAWPLFRSYTPGYVPWFLNSAEVRFLTIALREATDVALRFRDDLMLLYAREDDTYLVRTPAAAGKDAPWTDSYLLPEPPPQEESPLDAPTEERIKKVLAASPARTGRWEADVFFFPQAMTEETDRPYFLLVFAVFNQVTGRLLLYNISRYESRASKFRAVFLDMLEKEGTLPGEIVTINPDVKNLLLPLAGKLKISLCNVKTLKHMEACKRDILEAMASSH